MIGMVNMDKIKVFQIGCGKMSVYTMRYVYEHGGTIVGAVDINPNLIGKDIGEVMGTENKNVPIASLSNLEEYLKTTKPDIAIVTTMSLLNDNAEIKYDEAIQQAYKEDKGMFPDAEEFADSVGTVSIIIE